MTDEQEFWRLVGLAEHDPERYRLEMDCRQFMRIAKNATSAIDLDWCEKALREYFRLSEPHVLEVMRSVMRNTLFEKYYDSPNQNPAH